MSRRRFLFNGDVGSGLTHWQFKIWSDGELLGEKIVRLDGVPTVVPLSSSNAELIQQLFDQTDNCDYQNAGRTPSFVDLLIEDDALGTCIVSDFWRDRNWSALQNTVRRLIDEDSPIQEEGGDGL